MEKPKLPSYAELSLAYRQLHFLAQTLADGFRNDGDRYTWEAGMNPVEELREELERGRHENDMAAICCPAGGVAEDMGDG